MESVELGQPNRAVAVFDVAEDTAGTDGSQLLIITDQPNTAAAANNELDGGVQESVSAIPASSINTNVEGPILKSIPAARIQVLEGPGEFGECVAGRTGVIVELSSRCGGRS